MCLFLSFELDQISPLNEDEELPLLCSFLDEGDDDNLSIYSGEISVTESESDGSADDFVEVPLPSCFDVVAFQEGNLIFFFLFVVLFYYLTYCIALILFLICRIHAKKSH